MNTAVQLLKPHIKDLGGGFLVHRLLPSGVQRIEPGAINWMTAGRGIVHSERRPPERAHSRYVNHGLQLWMALPEAMEEVNATFTHTPADAIPEVVWEGATVRVLVGGAFGAQSPVATLSPTLYLDVELPANTTWTLPMMAEQQAVYAIQGELSVGGAEVPGRTLALVAEDALLVTGAEAVRLVVVGGQPLGRRFMWWNFVSSSKDRIEAASTAWERMDAAAGMGQDPGETERIDLPVR
jgi:hypothetical protein